MKIDNIEDEVTHDMENLRKKNETEIQSTMEFHSSRLEKAENRISELEDEMEIKGKTEELLHKQLKTCERNIQELTNSTKRPNLTGITTYLSITLNVNGLNLPIKDTFWQTGLKKKIQKFVAYRRPMSSTETNTGLG
jgi:predicted nuclease with TOPRIM domain